MIEFASRYMRSYERNYLTYDLKLEVVIHDLKIWRYYLLEKRVEKYIDHISLKHIFIQKELNIQYRRWLELVADYDLEMKYHPRKIDIVPDALNRRLIVKRLTQ